MNGRNLIMASGAVAIACIVIAGWANAGVLYPAPSGGWTYEYTGGVAAGGVGFTALDGTWSHDNGSDQWDETVIGTGRPGGVTGGLTADGTTYARFQETGDPRDHGMGDPGSIRKLYFGHDITAEGASASVLDDGVTVSFRARIATGGTLDDAHPDGGGAITPWPAGGNGYGLHNGGKANFNVHQSSGGTIGFSLALPDDGAANSTGGLVMNNLNGNAITGDVDTGDGGTANEFALSDATVWQEFWITIAGGGTGTHQASIYHNGSLTPTVYDLTAGDGEDYGDISYLAIGLGATGMDGAIDVDSFAWAPGVIAPVPEPSSIILAMIGLLTVFGFAWRRHR